MRKFVLSYVLQLYLSCHNAPFFHLPTFFINIRIYRLNLKSIWIYIYQCFNGVVDYNEIVIMDWIFFFFKKYLIILL